MRWEELLSKQLTEEFSKEEILLSGADDLLRLTSPKQAFFRLADFMKTKKGFDLLVDICVVDKSDEETRFQLNYILLATHLKRRVSLCVEIGCEDSLESVNEIWRNANWLERECYDFFGIQFANHPNLKRILSSEVFNKHYLRKNFQMTEELRCNVNSVEGFNLYHSDEELLPFTIPSSHPLVNEAFSMECLLSGEKVETSKLKIGLSHQFLEKKAESQKSQEVVSLAGQLNQALPEVSRIGYCKAVEKLMDIDIPIRSQVIRVIICEISRIIEHIDCITKVTESVGYSTYNQQLSSIKMKALGLLGDLKASDGVLSTLSIIGGMSADVPKGWFFRVNSFCQKARIEFEAVAKKINSNRVWQERTKSVGAISSEDAISWGITGPVLRASGVPYDLRRSSSYYGYENIDFEVPTGTTGDVFDRCLVRFKEVEQSLLILLQIARNVPGGDYFLRDELFALPNKDKSEKQLIESSMQLMRDKTLPQSEIYDSIESSNGELGFYLVGCEEPFLHRLKFRTPSLLSCQALESQVNGEMLPDVFPIIGSFNLISGEIDR